MIDKIKTIYIDYLPFKQSSNKELRYDHIEIFKKKPKIELLKNHYKPVAGDKLYIFPDCNIPRFKVKGFCEANNIAVVKYKEKANIWFTNESNLDELFSNIRYSKLVKKTSFTKYLKDAILRDGSNQELIKLNKEVNELECDHVIIKSNVIYICNNHGLFNGPKYEFLEKSDLEKVDDDGNPIPYDESLIECFDLDDFDYVTLEDSEKESLYLAILNHGNIYDESALVSQLNSELVMDKEIYEGMKNLFESSDSSNHKVAMESMANCDFLKSAVYLLFLVKEYKHKMYMSDMKNHVNFKSFLKFFDITLGNHMSFDDIIEILIDKDIMTRENLALIMPFATEEVFNSGETEYFKATGVTHSDEVEKAMAKHEVKPQPVQETEIEIPEIPTPEVTLNNFYSNNFYS
jgi:hypothetical protein